MTQVRYFQRTAWTLLCLSLYPAGAGIVALTSDEHAWGYPAGEFLGALILLATAGIVGGALVVVWAALSQSTFTRALLSGVGPLVVAVGLSFGGIQRELAEIVVWAAVLALPAVLGAAVFHGQDGRRWMRWGVPSVGAVLLLVLMQPVGWMPEYLLVSEGYLWLPYSGMAVLSVVLYWSLPGKSA